MDGEITERYRQAKRIALAANALSGNEREALIERETAGDPALRREVRWMLDAIVSTASGPELPLPHQPAADLSGQQATAGSPREYRLLRPLGEGGMGIVYLAERREGDFVQSVALKLLHDSAIGSPVLQERFQRERTLLARLQHPGIARLLDGGLLSDGRPFLAMECVDGERIDQWCTQRRPDLAQLVDLFLKVCDAVSYAHRHLVIHRDIKPANILVTAAGEPKLLDFGIARLLGDSTEVAQTRTGQHALTIAYASPEQIERQPLTVAADIYSLGVVLYQLLCGHRPYQHLTSPLDLSNAIVDGKLPAPSRSTPPPTADGSLPPRPLRHIPADVDAIVLKAMRRRADDRYATVDEMAADLQRFLQRRPVAARRGQRLYVARRFLQRNRWGLAAAGAIALSLVAGLGVSLYGLERAREQQRMAETRQLQLERMVRFQQSALASVDIDAMGHALATAQQQRVLHALQAGAGEEVPLDERVAEAFVQSGSSAVARDVLDEYVVSHALARVERDFGDSPQLAADLRQSLAGVLAAIGQYPHATTELRKVLAARETLPADDLRRISVRVDLGRVLQQQGQVEEAAALFDAASRQAAALPALDPLRIAADSGAVRVLAEQGHLLAALERQQALRLQWSGLEATDPGLLELRRDLVNTLIRLGRRDEARAEMEALLPLYRQRHGDEDATTLAAMLTLADLDNTRNEYEQSLALAREVAGIRERRLGDDHPDTLLALALVGANTVRLAQRQPAFGQAEAFMQTLIERQKRVLGEAHPQTLASIAELVRLLGKQGRLAPAIALQRQVLAARTESLGPEHPDTIFTGGGLASLLATAGQYDEARVLAQRTLRLQRRTLGDEHPITTATLDVIGRLEDGARRWEAARDAHRQALDMRVRLRGPRDAHTIESASRLYGVLVKLDDRAAMDEVRTRYLDPVIAMDPDTLNAGMRSVREEAIRATTPGVG